MSGGWNYKRLRQLAHKHRNLQDMEESKKMEDTDKFPLCRGTFDNCPPEEEMKTVLAKGFAPERCGRCHVFHETKSTPPVERKSPLMTPENMEFYLKMKGKKG